jgi:8-oxo-dGTP pyrophosphatase MutT (NUDIX family)
VIRREFVEETGKKIPEKRFLLCAILGQKLKSDIIEKFGVEYGYVFLHTVTFYKKPIIKLSHEHVRYKFYSVSEVIKNYKKFKSGPLWLFFTYLAFKETHRMQEGMIFDRRLWRGKEYL